MDRAFETGASASPPTAPASPSVGYPTAGNPATATPATKPGPWWYHMITEELRALVTAAGIEPSQDDLTQLLKALPGALASRPEMARSLAANGYQKFPGGLIVQWGWQSFPSNSTTTVTLPVAFPASFLGVVTTVRDSIASPLHYAYGTALPVGLSQFLHRAYYTAGWISHFWIAVGF